MSTPKRHIIFTVTNDLTYDQRMQRICSTLAIEGYRVQLVGRELPQSIPFEIHPFAQKRLFCFAQKGPLFYLEYNLRLFIYLLFVKADAFCAIDLDTILPIYFASLIRKKKRVYDAHELFTEQKEIVTRKNIYQIWLFIERIFVPRFKHGYTVNTFIKEELARRYHVNYGVVRNLPLLTDLPKIETTSRVIIYQGSVNEGRSFETLIPAMKQVEVQLMICGKGNLFQKVQEWIIENKVEEKVILKGYVTPFELKKLTPTALFGLTLFESVGLNQYYSLGNRFFDYIMAGIPQVCVGFPEYTAINDLYDIALLIPDTKEETIADAMNQLLLDDVLYKRLKNNCSAARVVLNWQHEQNKLIEFWTNIFT